MRRSREVSFLALEAMTCFDSFGPELALGVLGSGSAFLANAEVESMESNFFDVPKVFCRVLLAMILEMMIEPIWALTISYETEQ